MFAFESPLNPTSHEKKAQSMIDHYRKRESKSIRASGIEEPEIMKDSLIVDITEQRKEFAKEKRKKRDDSQKKRNCLKKEKL